MNRRDILSPLAGLATSIPFAGATIADTIAPKSEKILKSPFWDSGKVIKGTIQAKITDDYPFYYNGSLKILPEFPILYSVDIEYEKGFESYGCYNVSVEHLSKFNVRDFLAGIKSDPLKDCRHLCPDIVWEGYKFRMSFIMAKDEFGNPDFLGTISG